MLTGQQIVEAFGQLDYSHVVWLPDSVLGTWESALAGAENLRLVRVCREGEAWAIAAGLQLGGCRPVVVIQNTGLFESGDALRNIFFDLGLRIPAVIGYRSYLVENSTDSARRFTEPILAAWGFETLLVQHEGDLPRMVEHLRGAQQRGVPAAALVAEGRM